MKKHWWSISMAFFSALGFGMAAYHVTNALVGLDVSIGVFCFVLALVSGLSQHGDV